MPPQPGDTITARFKRTSFTPTSVLNESGDGLLIGQVVGVSSQGVFVKTEEGSVFGLNPRSRTIVNPQTDDVVGEELAMVSGAR